MIVANDVTKAGSGFGTDTNEVIIINSKGKVEKLPLMSKARGCRPYIGWCGKVIKEEKEGIAVESGLTLCSRQLQSFRLTLNFRL